MRFTLHYRGRLKSNSGATEKQRIRRALHMQLKALWRLPPFPDVAGSWALNPGTDQTSFIEPIGPFHFHPVISDKNHTIAELDLILLRPGAPGALLTGAGDIDNRLKTLLDALKVPHEPNALPPADLPQEGEIPFFCLLSDDGLVTRLNVDTASLLEPVQDKAEVELLIRVTTGITRPTMGNLGFA